MAGRSAMKEARKWVDGIRTIATLSVLLAHPGAFPRSVAALGALLDEVTTPTALGCLQLWHNR